MTVAENVILSIIKVKEEPLYLGPSYGDWSKIKRIDPRQYQIDKNNKKYQRMWEFWEQESHYSPEDYDDYLNGTSLSEIDQRQDYEKQLTRQWDIETDTRYIDNYINDTSQQSRNIITIPNYQLDGLESYPDPWKFNHPDDSYSNFSGSDDTPESDHEESDVEYRD